MLKRSDQAFECVRLRAGSASTFTSICPSVTCAPAVRVELGDRPVERRGQRMLHLHRFERQQALSLGNLFALRNLDRGHLPRHRRLDLAVVDAVRSAGAARGQRELYACPWRRRRPVRRQRSRRLRRYRLRPSSSTVWPSSATASRGGALSRNPASAGQCRLLFGREDRDRGGGAPDRLVRLPVSGTSAIEIPLDEAGVDLRRCEVGLGQRIEQEAGVGPHRPHLDARRALPQARRSPRRDPRRAPISLAIIGS